MTTDREEPITGVGEHADSWRSQAADGLLPVNVVSRDSHHKIGHLGPSKQDWRTPRALWNQLNAEFRFTLDAAADEDNTLCRLYYDQEQNALTKQWWTDSERGAIFVNPPYARLYPWVQKAYEESRKGATVVMLLPASTDTKWFHEIVQPYAEVRFIRGRLKFEGAKHPATFASMIVIFRPWKVTAGGAE